MSEADEWAWLRASDWRACVADPRVLPERIASHLQEENAIADAWFAEDPALVETLIAELRGRIEPIEDSLPVNDGPWAYVSRYREGDEYGVFLRRPRHGGEEAVLLDIENEAQGHEYFDHGIDHSPDHRHIDWATDTTGDERYVARVQHIATGRVVCRIEDVNQLTWATADTFFYSRANADLRVDSVFRHRLGDDPADDVLVYQEHDERFEIGLWTTLSGDWVIIDASMTDCNELHLVPTSDPTATPVVVEPRTAGLEYDLDHQRERFVILTNADDAADYQLVEAPVATPGRAHWKPIEPHVAGRLLIEAEALGDWLVITMRQDALPRVVCRHRDGRERTLAFDEEAYALGVDLGYEFEADHFRLTYVSPTTPARTFEQSLESGERTLLRARRIPSGHDPDDYITRRIRIASHDGVEVPVTLLYHRDTPLDGTAACLINGYGAYGSSTPASFDGDLLSLVDRGAVCVDAHVRGGQELGRVWYETGRLEHKTNSFEDLYAVTQGLVTLGFAASGRIVLRGGSAGGLLVAATMDLAVRRAPGLLAGVIADVPFVDVLNTMQDATLPMTPGEWTEWGNPVDDAAARERIASYCPYQRVGEFAYPALYVTASISDPRVLWWEPAKWVARLRERRTGEAPLLLRTNMESGHFGETGRYGELGDTARELAFFVRITGKA